MVLHRAVTTAVMVLISLSSCGIPRDPESTLDRVSGGTLRVGVAVAPPWTIEGAGDGPRGIEVEIVESFAAAIDAEPEWVVGQVEELAAAIEVGELDLLIGGLTSRSSIAKMASLTHPYLTTQLVVGAPPGSGIEDIAGVEVGVEERTAGAGLLEKTDAIPVPVEDVRTHDGPVVIDSFLLDDEGLEDTGVRLQETDHVFAAPHGENAFITRLERFLLTHVSEIRRILEDHDEL